MNAHHLHVESSTASFRSFHSESMQIDSSSADSFRRTDRTESAETLAFQ
jgi:hypothetical protein